MITPAASAHAHLRLDGIPNELASDVANNLTHVPVSLVKLSATSKHVRGVIAEAKACDAALTALGVTEGDRFDADSARELRKRVAVIEVLDVKLARLGLDAATMTSCHAGAQRLLSAASPVSAADAPIAFLRDRLAGAQKTLRDLRSTTVVVEVVGGGSDTAESMQRALITQLDASLTCLEVARAAKTDTRIPTRTENASAAGVMLALS